MDYCAPRGIPHSAFLGWDPVDQDKALTWLIRDRSRCPGCNVVPGEGDGLILEEYICPTCERLEQDGDPVNKGFKGVRKRLVTRPEPEA